VKGTNGYIRAKKRKLLLLIAGIVCLSAALFLVGWKTTGTKKNLLTVLAVLGVLPGAKAIVSLVLFLPYRSLDSSVYADISAATAGEGHLYSDLVFTSERSVMHLDSLWLCGTELVGLSLSGRGKETIVEYVTESLKKRGVNAHMHIFATAEEMCERVRGLAAHAEPVPEQTEEFVRMSLV